jgi:hypothetical protein
LRRSSREIVEGRPADPLGDPADAQAGTVQVGDLDAFLL